MISWNSGREIKLLILKMNSITNIMIITRINSTTKLISWLISVFPPETLLNIFEMAPKMELNSFLAIQTIQIPSKNSTYEKDFIFRTWLIMEFKSTTVEIGWIYWRIKFNNEGWVLNSPTSNVKIINVIGMKEKINPNEQELALSKMLFEKELAVVK